MREFNKSDYIKLSYLENKFRTAIDSRFCTGLIKNDLDACAEIYRETLGRNASLNCSSCVLQMMTQVGRLYFGYKEKLVQQPEQKKKGRPRNNDKK